MAGIRRARDRPNVGLRASLESSANWSSGIRRVLAASAFSGAPALSLLAVHPDRVVGILGALCGVGWGIWQVEQLRLRDTAKSREEEQRLMQRRHEELLQQTRRNHACARRVEGYRRRAADRSAAR
ncbi:hypothetical protein [Humibacillus xanthopallidus]|uniref:hypothetical protein n=1 Tax=Humibacillus xanthopallidus TaxID=412689 RepID=UPI001152D62A|nr:hypothetical protein [Humibacillus xanthopallidus]